MTLEIFTAKAIAELAFGKLLETVFDKAIEAGVDKLAPLRDRIRHRLKGDAQAELALMEVEKLASGPNLDRVATFLDAAMRTDKPFAEEIQAMAQQINQEIDARNIQDNSRTMINRDNAKGYQVENVKGENVQFGDVHNY